MTIHQVIHPPRRHRRRANCRPIRSTSDPANNPRTGNERKTMTTTTTTKQMDNAESESALSSKISGRLSSD